MENKNQSRNIDPQKIRAENLNGRFALVGLFALVGAYITTGQIVPGIIWIFQRIFSLSQPENNSYRLFNNTEIHCMWFTIRVISKSIIDI